MACGNVGKSSRLLARFFQAAMGIRAVCGFPRSRHFPASQAPFPFYPQISLKTRYFSCCRPASCFAVRKRLLQLTCTLRALSASHPQMESVVSLFVHSSPAFFTSTPRLIFFILIKIQSVFTELRAENLTINARHSKHILKP
jgi:hypothetical protein